MRIRLTIFLTVMLGMSTFAQLSQNDFPTDWTLYNDFNGISVEYKYQECNSGQVKNQVLVLFKFTNTTTADQTISWSVKHFRDGDCYNCQNIDSHEYAHELFLAAGQVIEADGTSKEDDNIYLFSSFINLVKGMPASKLTGFEFINVNVN